MTRDYGKLFFDVSLDFLCDAEEVGVAVGFDCYDERGLQKVIPPTRPKGL
jgi:hypothetical protein